MAGAVTSWKDTDILDLLTIVRNEGNARKIVQETTKADGDSRGVVQVSTKDSLTKLYGHHARRSYPVEVITLNAAPTTLALSPITVAGLPAGTTIRHAFLSLICRMVDNLSGIAENSLDQDSVPGVSQVIQIAPSGGVWSDAMYFVDQLYEVYIGAGRTGYKYTSNLDIAGAGKVTGNGTYALRWLCSKAKVNFLELRDAYFELEMEFEV